MKKTVAILFLIIYSLTTVNATVNMHYCMSKYVGAGLYNSKGKKCPVCGMEKYKSKGCCKDEHKFINLKREHQKTGNGSDFSFNNNPVLAPDFITNEQFSTSSIVRSYSSTHPPPDIQTRRLYILNCLLLI